MIGPTQLRRIGSSQDPHSSRTAGSPAGRPAPDRARWISPV